MANYCTLSDLKSALHINDSVSDVMLNASITAASRWIDGWCNRSFAAAGTAATDRDFIPTAMYDTLFIDDTVQVTAVKIDEDVDRSFATSLQAVDYQTEPVNSVIDGIAVPYNRLVPNEDGYWPMWRGQATVRVTARWGWPAVPEAVTQAALMQSSRLFARLDSPLGVAGFGDLGAMRVSRYVDPDVEALLQPYRLVRFA